MTFRIEETFQVEAPLPVVWSYLIDPRQVVRCIPGAELTGNEGERVFLGTVKVKVGPVTRATPVEQRSTRSMKPLTGCAWRARAGKPAGQVRPGSR